MKHNVVYKGVRGAQGCLVTCDGVELQPRRELRNHSPTGFEWGYAGSGVAQLALAMLCDFLQDDNKALEFYQEFKTDMLAPIGQPTWTIKSETMTEWIRHRLKQQKANAGKGPLF